MGLTEIQKEMIRGIATNNILKARQGALGALNEDCRNLIRYRMT